MSKRLAQQLAARMMKATEGNEQFDRDMWGLRYPLYVGQQDPPKVSRSMAAAMRMVPTDHRWDMSWFPKTDRFYFAVWMGDRHNDLVWIHHKIAPLAVCIVVLKCLEQGMALEEDPRMAVES